MCIFNLVPQRFGCYHSTSGRNIKLNFLCRVLLSNSGLLGNQAIESFASPQPYLEYTFVTSSSVVFEALNTFLVGTEWNKS